MLKNRLRARAGELKTALTSICWLTRHYIGLISSLEALGRKVRSLTPINISSWHRGARYFRAKFQDGQRIFLKTDGIYKLLDQEIAAAQRLNLGFLQRQVAPRVLFDDLAGRYPFAAFEWRDAQPLDLVLQGVALRGRIPWLSSQLITLLESLRSAKIIHRDITPKNLMVSFGPDGIPERLFLVDFAFSVIDGKSPADERVPIEDLHHLCTGFKPASLVWDDAFSCLAILHLAELTYGESLGAMCRPIEIRIGQMTHSVSAPDWPSVNVPAKPC